MFMPGAKGVAGGVTAITSALALAGFARGGFSVNHMDIAPKYAGILMGISNTAGTLAGKMHVFCPGLVLFCYTGLQNLERCYHFPPVHSPDIAQMVRAADCRCLS